MLCGKNPVEESFHIHIWSKNMFFPWFYLQRGNFNDHREVSSRSKTLVEQFGGHSRIFAVKSNNTSAFVKARRLFADKRRGVVRCIDHHHVIDLLIKTLPSRLGKRCIGKVQRS